MDLSGSVNSTFYVCQAFLGRVAVAKVSLMGRFMVEA